ncbi:hypothetical protein WR25_09762 [Diploscapter pachys]|uniref:Uncharacterized protein n=1 Tax=Diploscapter pachys TaxID=2018661 RepID=A0A2A2K3H3_9BILA|nr:hypothetical protein WR25_09762 [Diploscapter pachys]
MIAIGIIHQNDCSGQPLLPIWLIVMGLSAIMKTVIKMYYYIFQDGEREPYILRLFENLLDFGLFACFMVGCYLSIPAYLDPNRYVCDFFAVNLSFFFLLIYIVGSMAIACFCCSSAIYYIWTTPVQNHSDRESPV